MAANDQNGWNEYSKLVIAELERLNDGITKLNVEIQDLKREIAEMKVKEDFAKELNDLKIFKTQAITIFLVVQGLVGIAIALLKFYG